MKLKSFIGLFILSFFLVLQSCQKDNEEVIAPIASPGKLISYSLIKTMTLPELDNIRNGTLNAFLSGGPIPASNYSTRFEDPKYAVKLYKVTYESIIPEQGNRRTIATGLIAIPDVDTAGMPMISYQHGTVFSKYWAPSVPDSSLETQFMIAQFASQGYVLIAADYFGIGLTSTEKNSYFVRYSTEQACLDLYKASLKVLEAENIPMTKFFINGWSQGAYNTMLFLRRLERENIPVKAAFTAAAPVDPLLFVTRGLFNPRPIDAFYTAAALCNMMFGIEQYNNFNGLTERYIKSKYHEPARKLYSFESTFEQFLFVDSVPIALNEVFTQELFDDAAQANSNFFQVLASSEAYRWLSPTPLRAYYGMEDEAVPDYIASLAVNYMATLGKQNGTAINAGQAADHRSTYIESVVDAKDWIDSF